MRPHLNLTNDSWRVNETDIEVTGEWKYLERAVDSLGNTLDFRLRAKRDDKAAARFFRKVLKAQHTHSPPVINRGQECRLSGGNGNLESGANARSSNRITLE